MIVISNLSNKKTGKNYVYSDLLLDLTEQTVSVNKQNNKINKGNDIVLSTDENAIKNSVVNLIFQKRYLTPNLNIDIRRFIGQPITEGNSQILGNTILQGLILYEPRITVNKVLVGPVPDNYSYNISIIYTLNNFPKNIQSIDGILDSGRGVFTISNLNKS
jgi:phage baseplate assembly protein W